MKSATSFGCESCGRQFRRLFGIPDFRLRGDRYFCLSRNEQKQQHERACTHTFRELVNFYYPITDDVPGYVSDAPARSARVLDRFGKLESTASLLDIGCGSGGMEIAAQRKFQKVIGVDVALRWLVICRKRLEETGIYGRLVCAMLKLFPSKTQDSVLSSQSMSWSMYAAHAMQWLRCTERCDHWIAVIGHKSLQYRAASDCRRWSVGF